MTNVASRTEKAKQEQDNRHPLYGHQLPRARLKSRKSFLRFTRSSESGGSDQRRELWRERCPTPLNFIPPGPGRTSATGTRTAVANLEIPELTAGSSWSLQR
ncbi:hypothetical protein PYW08_012793 [Mythimna loreyi]|uniref:Uncharacterized protein n=1 Tax=Mythimna loreyi TaxID=667449 RepID=A0ACC2Q3Y8_9NEOP|nr:hypothetical protein PYW08_012793 [Mythimna loreyi]